MCCDWSRYGLLWEHLQGWQIWMTILGYRGGKRKNRKKESSLLKLDWVINLEVTVISGMAAFNHENLKIIHLGKGKRSVALNIDLSSNLVFTILYIKCGSFFVSSELLFLYLKFGIITGFHYEGYIYLYWKTMEVLTQASLRGLTSTLGNCKTT